MNRKRILIGALVISQALDLITTFIGFNFGLYEGNVVPSMILASGGNLSLALFKLMAVGCMVAIILIWGTKYPKAWQGIVLATIITTMVVASNMVNIAMAAGN